MAKKAKKKTRPSKRQVTATQKKVQKSTKPLKSFPKFTKLKELVIGFVLIGLLIRLVNLSGLTLWVDEYVHVLGVRDFIAGNGPLMPYDGNGFLYNVLMLPFFAIFGDSPFLGRLPSVLAGAGSIYLIYILAKEILNEKIGIYVAFFTAFSLYMIFWSRVARNYSIFLFTYLLLLWTFYKALNPIKESLKDDSVWERFNISPKYLGMAVISLILAYFSHKLVLFFFFSAVFYFIFMAMDTSVSNRKFAILDKYSLLAIPSLIFLVLFFTPSLTSALRPILGSLIPQTMIDWVLPDWTEISRLWKDEQYVVYDIYKNILTYDTQYIHYLGLLGFAATFLINRQAGYFLLSFFVVPFLLMSFVLRGVYNPRYFVFLYPIFLIGMATGFYFLLHWLPNKLIPKQYNAYLYNFCLFIPFVLFLIFSRQSEVKDLIMMKEKRGYVVSQKLSKWSFTNWRETAEFLKKNMKDGDVVMSTLTNGLNYYMGWEGDGAMQFRQTYLDISSGEYVNYVRESSNMNAQSTENVKRTIKEHDRGWLLADYYFETIYTDYSAREFIYKNCDLHFEATSSGDVLVFSWDKNKPKVFPDQEFALIIGRNHNSNIAVPLYFPAEERFLNQERSYIEVAIQGNDADDEAFFVLNGDFKYYINANKTKGIEKIKVRIKPEHLKREQNSIQFGYDPESVAKDPRRGYAIHAITLF